MRRIIALSLILASTVVLLSSCSCYKKMSKKANTIEAKCNPELLSLKGTTVNANITVTFPPKFFDELAVMKITPVLVYDGGEIAGTPKFVQGTNVKDNFTVIPYKTGGSYTQSLSFPYDPRASISTLVLRVEAKCTESCSPKYNEYIPLMAPIAIAQGISSLQNDAHSLDYLAPMADNYKRTSSISKDAQIMYEIGKANVRPAQLTTDQVKMFEDFVKENSGKERVALGSVYSKGYASPDGPVDLNDKLSKQRGESGQVAISKQLTGIDAKYDVAAYGEDWDGFKALVEQSDIQDKALILQVLQTYDNPVERDEEIKNMSAVFDVLAKEILPQLRRTKLTATAEITGKTDAELLSAAKSNMGSLTLEELLYAGNLSKDNVEKIKIYTYAGDKFNDARAYNNLGVVLMQEGQLADAQKYLNKAAALKSSPEISNNLGALAVANGDVATAKKYLSSLNTPQAKANLGLVALSEGDYATAEKTLKGYDLALAEVLNGDLTSAKSAIAADQSADANYLKAVIASREGDTKGAVAYLKSAIAKNPEMRSRAKGDIEFVKLFELPEFKAL